LGAYASDSTTPHAETATWEGTPEEKAIVREVEGKYEQGRQDRQQHEPQWYVNAAFFRGHHYVEWSGLEQRLIVPPAPIHREHRTINRVQPKIRARIAKFLKNRPIPICVPATEDIEDKQNAEVTTKALDYAWRKFQLERCYKDAIHWAAQTGHGYWWFHWDPQALGKVLLNDGVGGKPRVEEALLGDIKVEVGSPWELVVADPAITYIGDQPWIMRVKVRPLADVKALHPEKAKFLRGDVEADASFRYERAVATLTSRGRGAMGTLEDRHGREDGKVEHLLVKEMFTRPCAEYPFGKYCKVAGGVLLEEAADELPYGFADLPNPYPVVDFKDIDQAGQYWGTTILEQLIEPQREYNLIRSKIDECIKKMVQPKIIAARQHQIAKGAFTAEAAEIIEVNLPSPQFPLPLVMQPGNVAADAWRTLEAIREELDDISHIFPESEGRVGEATSGFQTNLLQEATDAVHAPDVRGHELAIEEAAYKIRRLMKYGYTIPRLITVVGRNMESEAFEFSSESIDEHGDVIVQAGSALPTLKGAKIQSVLELYNAQVLGDPADPAVKRKTLQMLEMGTIEEAFDQAKLDERAALLENQAFREGKPVADPDFWDDHTIHSTVLTSLLKSPSFKQGDPNLRTPAIRHLVLHAKWMNPQAALQIALQYGIQDVAAQILQEMMATQGAGQVMAPAPPPGEGAPPPADAAANGNNQANPEFGMGAQGDPNLV
jgi:hypothetical protein